MKIEEFIDKMKYLDDIEHKINNIEYEIKEVRNMYIEYLEAIEYIQDWIYSIETQNNTKQKVVKNMKNRINRKNRYIIVEQSKNFYILLDRKNRQYIAVKR